MRTGCRVALCFHEAHPAECVAPALARKENAVLRARAPAEALTAIRADLGWNGDRRAESLPAGRSGSSRCARNGRQDAQLAVYCYYTDEYGGARVNTVVDDADLRDILDPQSFEDLVMKSLLPCAV